MNTSILFSVKQLLKMALQNIILPIVYRFWRIVYCRQKPDLIIFADAHHDELPFSMERIHNELLNRGYHLTDVICNYSAMSQAKACLNAIQFMRLYAKARYVFICDNFLPVSSCKKNEKTTVVQLMHSCGTLKKIGYDTLEDIPLGYRGDVYRNYDLVTVSSPTCVAPFSRGMRQKSDIVQSLGVSRTDAYFDLEWIENCKKNFYAQHPDAKGKSIILWAPTFRGNASDAHQVGTEEIKRLELELGEKFYIIYKAHPHVDNKYHLSTCSIPTEQLLPVADLLITDYSSIVIDYLFFCKPYVLFAPDIEEYLRLRGFYIDYYSLTPHIVTNERHLQSTVLEALKTSIDNWTDKNRNYHLASCDGHSTERILNYLGL